MVEELVHVTFYEYNPISRKVISDDVDKVEQNLKKLDLQPSSTNELQKEDESQETSLSKQNADENQLRE